MNEIDTTARQTIARGSKSFYLASLFFSRADQTRCWALYRWCRYCDDQIDEAPDAATSMVRLTELRERTRAASAGSSQGEVFNGLRDVCLATSMPARDPLDLIEGFAMDVQGVRYETIQDLEVYGYHVAGVVGVMMSRIVGVTSPLARPHAVALGTAMQLTNIARDVREDFANGRVYLPTRWLRERGLDKTNLLDPENQKRLFQVVQQVLARADELYRVGRAGFRYLPFRARLAVAIASSVYARIGHKILREGSTALDRRIVVSWFEKIALVGHGLYLALEAR